MLSHGMASPPLPMMCMVAASAEEDNSSIAPSNFHHYFCGRLERKTSAQAGRKGVSSIRYYLNLNSNTSQPIDCNSMTIQHGIRRRRGVPSPPPLSNSNEDVFTMINRHILTNKKKKSPLFCYKHNKRKNKTTFLFPTTTTTTVLLLLILILITTTIVQAQRPAIPATDNYCGPSWVTAANICTNPCPSKSDTECKTPGHKCFQFTGCQAKLAKTSPPTSKPTKKPTSKPTISAVPTITPIYPSRSPSNSPSGMPTGSPLVNWYPYLDTTINNGNGNGGGKNTNNNFMSVKDDPSSRSFGCIFELTSTIDSPAISIRSFEFYISYDDELFASTGVSGGSGSANVTAATSTTNATATITYELWTRPQTWHGFEGRVRAFDQLTSGTFTITNGQLSQQNEKLIAVTIHNFDPIKINGGGTDRRAIYVTLSKRNMLYQRSSEPLETKAISSIEEVETQGVVTKDSIILASTNHLIVYEGAAVMTYPFKEAKDSIFYRYPRGFVGRIEYDREPCELIPVLDDNGKPTGEFTSVQKWEECTEGTKAPRPTVKPTVWVKPSPPTTKQPSATTGDGSENTTTTVDNNVPILSPSSSPSISTQPSKFIMKSYLILTFNNISTQGRVMDAREQNSFEKSIVSFLNRQKAVKTNEVYIEGATTWYQQTYTTEEREEQAQKGKKKGDRNKNNGGGGGGGRVLQVAEEVSSLSSSSSGQEVGATDLIVPSPPMEAPLLEITIIISVERSPLPQKITSQLFETMIRNSKTEFLASLKEVGALTNLFSNTNDIPTVLSVERVTSAPTLRPTRSPVVEVELEEEEEAPALVGFFFGSALRIALLIIGLVWVGLVLVGFTKIKKARRIMKIQRDRGVLGEDSFKTPYHGMVYEDDEKKKKKGYENNNDLRKSNKTRSSMRASSSSGKKGMRASLLGGGFGGGGKKKKKSEDLKDNEAYSEGEDYNEESDEDMSSMEDSYSSSEEDLSVDGSSSGSY